MASQTQTKWPPKGCVSEKNCHYNAITGVFKTNTFLSLNLLLFYKYNYIFTSFQKRVHSISQRTAGGEIRDCECSYSMQSLPGQTAVENNEWAL